MVANTLTSRVIARNGLRLRSGPGLDFDIIQVLSSGTTLCVLKVSGDWSMVDLQGDGIADGFVSSHYLQSVTETLSPNMRVTKLIELGSTAVGLKQAREMAAASLPGYPHNGCAAHLSALLLLAGFPYEMIWGAGKLAHYLAAHGWQKIAVGQQQAGDVGVCFDNNPSPPGADHIYLVIETIDTDRMIIADNQRDEDETHPRNASGKAVQGQSAKTPTEYFLRSGV